MDAAIQKWIENGDETAILELDDLDMEELPELPKNLQKLYYQGCYFKKLPELPYQNYHQIYKN